jgi:hypothetical protein
MWARCERLTKRLRHARFFGWLAAIRRCSSDLVTAFDRLRFELYERQKQLSVNPQRLATVRDLLLDLAVLYQEFDQVEFDLREGTLRVSTEPITLDDKYLGSFSIVLQWKGCHDTFAYRIVALDPQPATRDSTITHPHVQDEILCEGDGRPVIRAALAGGRLYDFFCLVANILRNYNSSSPYVALSEWSGSPCSDCGGHCDEDDSTTCSRCEDQVCDDCCRCCNVCGDYHCSSCTGSCSACQESTCMACLETCHQCGESVCNNCLTDNHLCESCHDAQVQSEPTPAGTPA